MNIIKFYLNYIKIVFCLIIILMIYFVNVKIVQLLDNHKKSIIFHIFIIK